VRTPHPLDLFGDDLQEWAQGEDTPAELAASRVVEAPRGVLDPET